MTALGQPSPEDVNLTLAQMAAHPVFKVSLSPHWTRPRWELVRRNGADPGLYCLITADLNEVVAALTAAETEPAGPGPDTGPGKPGPPA
jgi:hypothetical protein